VPGYSRLDEIQAALLRVKLKYLDTETAARRAIARRYLSGIRNPRIVLPSSASNGTHAWHLFVVRCKDRDALQRHLRSGGIGTQIHYPVPPHRQPAFAAWHGLSLPLTEAIHREVLSLPLAPTLNDDEVQQVIDACNAF